MPHTTKIVTSPVADCILRETATSTHGTTTGVSVAICYVSNSKEASFASITFTAYAGKYFKAWSLTYFTGSFTGAYIILSLLSGRPA